MKLPGPEDVDTVREGLDLVFSRKVLGAVIVAVAAKKMLALGFHLLFDSTRTRFLAWSLVFLLAITLFTWWEYAERRTEEVAKTAAEKTAVAAEKAADKAAEKTEHEKVQKAERATDAVADRVKGPSADASGSGSGDDSGTGVESTSK